MERVAFLHVLLSASFPVLSPSLPKSCPSDAYINSFRGLPVAWVFHRERSFRPFRCIGCSMLRQIVLYLLGLIYCFLGVAIIADARLRGVGGIPISNWSKTDFFQTPTMILLIMYPVNITTTVSTLIAIVDGQTLIIRHTQSFWGAKFTKHYPFKNYENIL